MNKFYAISIENQEPTSHQLRHLGDQHHVMSFGSYKRRDDFGRKQSDWQHLYRPTTPEDYDKEFAYQISRITPPYRLSIFLDYHFNDYLHRGNEKSIFFQHIKYVILPIMRKRAYAEEYIELVNDWVVQSEKLKISSFTLKATLQKLIQGGSIDKVLERFLKAAEENNLDCAEELTLLSARYANLKAEKRKGTLYPLNEQVERNQINAALVDLVKNLEI